jgi:hypothetical protein
MDLNFEIFMIVLLVLSIVVVGNFLRDGESNYLEGALLVVSALLRHKRAILMRTRSYTSSSLLQLGTTLTPMLPLRTVLELLKLPQNTTAPRYLDLGLVLDGMMV